MLFVVYISNLPCAVFTEIINRHVCLIPVHCLSHQVGTYIGQLFKTDLNYVERWLASNSTGWYSIRVRLNGCCLEVGKKLNIPGTLNTTELIIGITLNQTFVTLVGPLRSD